MQRIPILKTSNSYNQNIDPVKPEPGFYRFHQLFSRDLNFLVYDEIKVIAVIPLFDNLPSKFTYDYHNKIITYEYESNGGIMLFLPPPDCSIFSLNIRGVNAKVYYDNIKCDLNVDKKKLHLQNLLKRHTIVLIYYLKKLQKMHILITKYFQMKFILVK